MKLLVLKKEIEYDKYKLVGIFSSVDSIKKLFSSKIEELEKHGFEIRFSEDGIEASISIKGISFDISTWQEYYEFINDVQKAIRSFDVDIDANAFDKTKDLLSYFFEELIVDKPIDGDISL
jgi:hypothetical protein